MSLIVSCFVTKTARPHNRALSSLIDTSTILTDTVVSVKPKKPSASSASLLVTIKSTHEKISQVHLSIGYTTGVC